jgi:uncharacterized membrane protein
MSDWYYAFNNEQKGPINESELKADLATNKLPADTLVWKDGMASWTPANQVPAFVFRAPPTAAKLPTPPAAPAAKADPAVNNPSSTTPVDLSNILGTPESLEVDPDDAEKNKIFGILSYLSLLFIVVFFAAKDSPFAKYHANQGFALFLLSVVVCIIANFLTFAFAMIHIYIGWIFGFLYLGIIGLAILGIINAAAGKCVPLPVIGGLKIKLFK